jgi:hypothetical protein
MVYGGITFPHFRRDDLEAQVASIQRRESEPQEEADPTP